MNIFSYNKDIRKNAYVNWRTNPNDDYSNFAIIGDGYLKGAQILIEDCLNNNANDNRADIVIFPILHGVIHGTEVYLKSIYNILALWLKEDKIHLGGHDIKQLYDEVSGIFKRFEKKLGEISNIKKFKSEMIIVDEFIAEIYDKTKKMDFVRYPVDSKKENHFYVECLENVVIDLEILSEKVSQIHEIFNTISLYYIDIYDELTSY